MIVTINVSGSIFQTERSTLQNVQNTRLSNEKLLQENYHEDSGQFFFDRDPHMFSFVLNMYRTGDLHLPSGMCSSSIKKELEFWRIPEERVSECCWKELYQIGRETNALKELNDLFKDEITDYVHSVTLTSGVDKVRHNLWMLLEYPSSSVAARVWEGSYFSLIITSAVIYMLDSVEALRVPEDDFEGKCNMTITDNMTLPELWTISDVEMKYILKRPMYLLSTTDLYLTVVFTIELLVRFIVSPRKFQFVKSFLNILDFVFLVCKYPLLYFEHYACFFDEVVLTKFASLKTITVIRLFRLFRIGKSIQGFRVMFLSIKASVSELCLMIGVIACATVLFGAIIYMVEMRVETFNNVFYACWWAVITMTTVGYGDFQPVTPLGYIVGTACALTGLVVLTLPIAVIGTNFSDYYSINRARALQMQQKKIHCQKKSECYKGPSNINKVGDQRENNF